MARIQKVKNVLATRTTLVWALLVAVTAVSWSIGHAAGIGSPRAAGMAVLILAIFKVRLVLLEFMELRHAPRPLCWLAQGWAVLVCGVLLALFAATPSG
jgi:heme/copper-type cytochrome/quinol oxidase subunit 4